MKSKTLIAVSLVVLLSLLALLAFPAASDDAANTTNVTRTVDVWAEPTRVAPYEVSTVFVKVTEDGTPAANISIYFRTNFGYLIDNRSMTYTTVTDEDGRASVRFFAEESGTATVTAAEKTGVSNETVVVIKTTSSSGNGNGGSGSSSGNGGTTPTPTPTALPTESPSPTTASPTATPTLTPTSSPTETPLTTATATPSPTASPTSEPLIPGFEAVFAIAGLLAVTYLVLRWKREY